MTYNDKILARLIQNIEDMKQANIRGREIIGKPENRKKMKKRTTKLYLKIFGMTVVIWKKAHRPKYYKYKQVGI